MYCFLNHFVSFFNWAWLVILILFQILFCSFKNCLEFSGVYKPKPRVWGSKSSQREVENYVIFFLTERGTMRSNIFRMSTLVTMRLSKQWRVEEKTTLFNKQQNALTCKAQASVWADLTADYFIGRAFWLLQLVIIYYNILAWMNVSRNYRSNRFFFLNPDS